MSITISPSLDVASVARIRYPAWLKDLYNKAQLECTSLDRCGAFHLVALNKDWDEHPGNNHYYNHFRRNRRRTPYNYHYDSTTAHYHPASKA
jgi:hypothetical protein